MSLVFRHEFAPNVISSVGSNRVRFGEVSLTQAAAVGEPAMNTIGFDDPAGELTLVGYRYFSATETSAPSNNQVFWRGRTLARSITRAPSMRTTTARKWMVDLADENILLGWRVMMAASANRPAETAQDRLTWLVNTRRVPIWAHPDYCAADSTAMDAVDYRGQRYNDVLADIANATGFNFWAEYNEGRERSELFFMDPNSDDYVSVVRISNDLADIGGNTYAPSQDFEVKRDPSRVTASAYVAYDGGFVYKTRDSTGNQFAFVDQSAPLANVKSRAKAEHIADRYLNDNDEEDDKLAGSIIVPAANVNDLRTGQLTQVKLTHVPGYEDFVYCRVTRRTVIQEEAIGQAYYRIALELSPTTASPVLQTVTLVATNSVTVDAERNGADQSAPLVIEAGQVWAYTITNTQHADACWTDSLKLSYIGAGLGEQIVRRWGLGSYFPVDYAPPANWLGTGYPEAIMEEQTGTFVIAADDPAGVFYLQCKGNYQPGPVSTDEQWTCVLERIG